MLWFFSDPHFWHANIIRYSNRPYRNVDEMNDAIIENTNALVGENDELFCLGDWAMYGGRGHERQIASDLLRRFRCRRIHLVFGNHDKPRREIAPAFTSANDMMEIKVPDGGNRQSIVLCHYALRVWNKSHHGSWHLYGHSHGSLTDDPHSLSFDVGVDCHDYKPISYDQVKAIMARKTWKPVDHHGKRDIDRVDRDRI